MRGWLLDTNVLSELERPSPAPKVKAFVDSCPVWMVFISTMSLAEIRCGIELLPPGSRRADLENWLATMIRPTFGEGTLQITEDVLYTWRLLAHRGRRAGRTYSAPDLMLAATAVEHDLILVTRNTRDFSGLPIQLLNPWD